MNEIYPDIDYNSVWLMSWYDRMVEKYGHPRDGDDWCRKLAYYVGEAGNESPSEEAIHVAYGWELNNPEGEGE
jgi:hypothetical protein